MSSKKTNPQNSNVLGQPENVKTVNQETQQNALAFSDQEDKNVGNWTKITSDRSARRILRREALAQREKKYFTPSNSERKGSDPSFNEQRFLRSKAFSLAEDERKQNEFNSLEAKVTSLSSTLDKLLLMLQGQAAAMLPNQQISQAAITTSPTKSEGENEKSNVPHFNVNSPSTPTSPTAASFKDALGRKIPFRSQQICF